MRVSPARWWLLPWMTSFLLAGCGNDLEPAGLQEEEDLPPDIVRVTGTVSTLRGDRVEFVDVRLFGVFGDSLNPNFALLAQDTTDATGAFLVEYEDCQAYPRFFVDLEIACFPIGLREVGCGAWNLAFVWNPPGASGSQTPCVTHAPLPDPTLPEWTPSVHSSPHPS